MTTEAQPAARRFGGRIPLLRPLALRDFRLLWAGESISVMGDQFYLVALPWLVLQLTGSAVALGTVLIAAEVPRALLILFGGVIADRSSPRLLMLGSNIARGIIVGLLAVLVLTGHAQLWQLYVLSAMFGAVGAIFYPAFDSIAPLLVDSERLGAGNALLQGSAQFAGFLGPVLAGIIIASVGTLTGSGYALAFDAFTFAVSALSLLIMRGGVRPRKVIDGDAGEEDKPAGMFGAIAEGVLSVARAPVMRALFILMLAANFAIGGPFEVGIPALARNHFGSAAAFGGILAAFGVGALIGTIVAGSMNIQHRRGLLIIGVSALFSAGAVGMGLAPDPAVAGTIAFILGASNGFLGVSVITWMQTGADPSMLGRVMSLFALAGFGLTPFSLALAGVLAQLNVTLLFILAGGLMACVTVWVILTPAVRSLD
jgi:MFS family permease